MAQVRLEVESRPENLALVRRVLAAFADAIAVDGELLGDIETAVSEACNNVVRHAYGTRSGPMVVTLDVSPEAIEAQVADRGDGMHRVSAARDSFGIGLPVIGALADQAEFRSDPERGTSVRMKFGLRTTKAVSSPGRVPPERRQRADALPGP